MFSECLHKVSAPYNAPVGLGNMQAAVDDGQVEVAITHQRTPECQTELACRTPSHLPTSNLLGPPTC